MSQLPPTTLGKYQIIREIARSNDIVYEAYDPAMNRRVAVKELNVPQGSTPAQLEERVRRFHREIKAAGSLAHPNIVTIYEVGEDRGRHFMAMEFLDGKTLRNELDTQGLIPPERAFEIAAAVLEALSFAHANGVIHRDIKPENIQLLSSGRVKLTDFGIARLTFEPNITMDGQVFGTPSYMSPEQVVGKDLDARSDLFAVGAVLYEMLAGQKAFPGDSVVSISYAIMNKEPEWTPSVHPAALSFLRGLLEKSVSLRTASAEAALTQLRAAKEQPSQHFASPPPLPIHAYPTGSYPTYPTYPPPVVGQHPQQQQSSYPNLPPIPSYIPPPKLPPLISAEAKQAMGRFIAIAVSVALVFGLTIVGIRAMAGAAERIASEMRSPASPTADRQPPVSMEARQLAVRYAASARSLMDQGNWAQAEQMIIQAIQTDPGASAHAAQYGDLLARMAQSAAPTEAARLWARGGEQWRQAANLETDPARRARMQSEGARMLLSGARVVRQAGDRPGARRILYEAKRLAPEGSVVQSEINSLLDEIG